MRERKLTELMCMTYYKSISMRIHPSKHSSGLVKEGNLINNLPSLRLPNAAGESLQTMHYVKIRDFELWELIRRVLDTIKFL